MAFDFDIEKGPFKPTWESLRTYTCPDWFRDAKLGIWAHWGPQCVPMFGDWYARFVYSEGTDCYYHHWRVYGHPSKHGHKDLVKLWKAERFDPDALLNLYAKAGAKYFVALAVHHDNFDNWNSTHHRWNAVNFGPNKDIITLWRKAAEKKGLPFGVSEHLAASFSWFCVNKGTDKTGPYAGVPYDGNDPAYEDLYHANQKDFAIDEKSRPGLTTDTSWHEQWFRRVKDLIDQHKPDFIYSDSGVPFEAFGLNMMAHLYNTSAKRHGGVNQAVSTQKDRNPEVYKVGVLDLERSGHGEIMPEPWQTCTCVAGWFYDVRGRYKTPMQIIEMLIDTVSKNGNLLLNFTQKPDGSLDDECLYILDRMAKWMEVNGEGIFGTRPWKVFGEGTTQSDPNSYQEDVLPWTSADFRFTTKGSRLYAFQMRWPDDKKATVKSLAAPDAPKVTAVRLLGHNQSLRYTQDAQGIHISLASEKTGDMPHAFCIETS